MADKEDFAPKIDLGDIGESEPIKGSTDAPYGYKANGQPYQRRPPQRGIGRRGGGGGRRGTTGSLRTQIGGMLVTVNMPIQIISSKNALDAVEIDALAKALDEECQRNARFRKYMEQMLAVQGGTSLILVVAAIAGRRVIRNNLVDVPKEVGGNEAADAIIGGFISMTAGNGPINPNLMTMSKQDA